MPILGLSSPISVNKGHWDFARRGTDFIEGVGDVGIFNNINSSPWGGGRGRYHLFDKQRREDWVTPCRSMEVDPFLTPLSKVNSK